jgi:DMSO/TMAO reductase YedYZ molybdopterin-dependent catalytic subunit
MKTRWIFWLLTVTLLAACGGGAAEPASDSLLVSDGTVTKTYTVDDLAKLPVTEATFQEVGYKGVVLAALLQDAGIDPAALKAVKAVASDGYSVNYEPALFLRQDVLVAYAQAAGPLTADDGLLRLVIPDAEGKLNVRMLTKIEAVP